MAPSGQRLKNALKTAALLPARAVRGSSRSVSSHFSGARQAFAPAPGETPIVILRLQVVSCTGLLVKDKSGLGDPFVVVSLLHTRRNTPTCKRTLNPTFPPKDSTFEFPIYLSVVEKMGGVGVIELVVWDRDHMLKREYLGEVGVGVGGWFRAGALGWDDPDNKPLSLGLESTRANTAVAGSVCVKLGFVASPNTASLLDFEEVLKELRKREGKGRASWVSAPPTRGFGTIRSHPAEEQLMSYGDDGGLSSAEEYEPEEEEGSEAEGECEPELGDEAIELGQGPPKLVIDTPTTPTVAPGTAMPASLAKTFATPARKDSASEATPKAATGPSPKTASGFIPKMKFPRRKAPTTDLSSRSPSVSSASSTLSAGTGAGEGSASETNTDGASKDKDKKKRVFRKRWSTGSSSNSSSSAVATLTPLTTVGDVPGAPPTAPAQAPANEAQQQQASAGGNDSGTTGAPVTVSPAQTPVASKGDYMFEAGNDIMGIVMLEIIKAENLPKLKNVTRTGFDMDPFVVISFGKKVFRTRVLRHTLNPIWDEKVLFHVRRYETGFQVSLTILDWDKLSSNDLVGDANFEISSLIEMAPQPDPKTGLYAPDYSGDHPMKEMKLDVAMAKDIPWELTQTATPAITIRAKYQPYAALRQRFWRQYLTQYDTDDTGAISQLELRSMLDSLGSTLTKSTIESFYLRYGKNPEEDELSLDEAIQCLETELCRPLSEKKRVDVIEESRSSGASASTTPILTVMDKLGKDLDGAMQEGVSFALHEMNFSGRPAHPQQHLPDTGGWFHHQTEPNQVPLSTRPLGVDSSEEEESSGASSGPGVAPGGTSSSSGAASSVATGSETGQRKKLRFRRMKKKTTASPGGAAPASNEVPVERVINVKNCPLCHRPRLNAKAEMDIVTHLAVCASQDWNQVDRIMVGNFVTASQAQRKWYTNVLDRIYAGQYRLGANSANIIVQNRITGRLEEEKMQVYVRLGIRLLYKGAGGRMEGSRARGLLKSLSIKQGRKYDSPDSAKEIPSFVQFHQLNVDEILNPIASFKTFNEFFYRKLKPDARPVEHPDDPYRLVSGADCRFMAFETVSEATKIWIKGREFTVGRLLGDNYKDEAEKYTGGALGIFRLAPQDYHRFHCPVDGTIGRMTYISGEYYTVNPQAIRTALDVYGENVRKIVPIDSPQFGRVMAVCVGAMMVGTIKTTAEEGQQVRRGQEFGYFAFGGSTIVLLFEKGVLEWDEDLIINGRASLETLVRVGMGIGRGKRPAAT